MIAMEPVDNESRTHDAPSEPLLELENASLIKDGRPILRDLNLRIEAGSHTAILGANGSGKSSLIKLITREEYPYSRQGRGPSPVRIWGRTSWDVFALRPLLGLVSANVRALFARESDVSGHVSGPVTGMEAVLSGFFASRGVAPHHQITPAMRKAAQGALERVEAVYLAEQTLSTMSTGEVQRILLARALVNEPPALLLDEPTSGLDLVARQNFLSVLRRVAHSGTTLVLVTHHVEEIVPEIERVVLLREGTIVADGPKSEILVSERLGTTFGAALRVEERAGFYRAHIEG